MTGGRPQTGLPDRGYVEQANRERTALGSPPTGTLPPPAAVAGDGKTWRLGGSGSLPAALPPPAAAAGDGETWRLGGSGSLPAVLPPPAAAAGDG